MFVIFLDVDGVLNDYETKAKAPTGFTGVDDDKITVLKRLVDHFDAKIVLTSTWKMEWSVSGKNHGKDMVYLLDKLSNQGLSVYDITKDITPSFRGNGVLRWIDKVHGEVDDYIVLDDFDFDFDHYDDLRDHVVIMDDGIATGKPFSDNPVDSVLEAVKIITEFAKS